MVFRSRDLLLSTAPNALSQNRYGFVITKAVGNAVTRNRVRRQLREAVRLLHPDIKPGNDIVVVARRSVVGKPFAEIMRIVKQLVAKAELLTDE